jgi:L-iditol 2-dehydrogenase
MDMMRASRMVDVGRMVCEEIEIPRLGDNQVMVKSEMASICGSDLHMVMMGAGLAFSTPCPHGYPGHEGIGQIVESKVEGLDVGTHVLTFPNPPVGECFNEYQRVGATYCTPLPAAELPRTHLLMAQQLGTVVFARRKRPRDVLGETVVVMGQGSAGLFWTYLLKRAGAAQVIVSDLSDARLAVAKSYGADVCVNAATGNLREVVADLESVELSRAGGELMWFGLPSLDGSIDMRFDKFFRKRLTASSVFGAQDESDAVSFREALRLISTGQIDVEPLLSHVYDVSQVGDAMNLAHEPHDAGALKVSISFD